jgi:YfiR/HmsC-like
VALLNRCRQLVRPGIAADAKPDFPAFASTSRRTLGLILFGVYSVMCAKTAAEAQSQSLSESQIKAGFLFNFTKFVEWPPEVFADPGVPIVLGIVGDNPVTELLIETAVGKTVNGRTVIVQRFKEGQDPRTCHILFVGSSQEKHVPQILERLKASPILTVSETAGFAQSGGMINFVVEGNKVRLEINLDATARARLKISAKVIAVARLVTGEPPGGKS